MNKINEVWWKLENLSRILNDHFYDYVECYGSVEEAEKDIRQELKNCLYDNRYSLTMAEYDYLYGQYIEGNDWDTLDDWIASTKKCTLAVCRDIIKSFRRGLIPEDIAADAIRREFIDWEVRYY